MTINPRVIYQGTPDRDGVITQLDVVVVLPGATANTQIVPASAGKIIGVLHGNLCSTGAASLVTFKSATGGTSKRIYQVPVNTAATPNVNIEHVDGCSFRTNVGEALFAGNTGADPVDASVTYIIYAP